MFKALFKTRMQSLFSTMFSKFGKNKKPSAIKKVLGVLLALYVFGALFFSVGMMFSALAQQLPAMGLEWLYFAVVGVMTFALGFIGCIFVTEKQLFESTDNELLLSMPIPPMHILASRMASLLILEYVYCAIIYIPAVVVYFINATLPPLGIVFLALSFFIAPLLVLAVAAPCGWLLAFVNSRVSRKNLVTTVFLIVFLFGYMYLYMNAQNFIAKLVSEGVSIAAAWRTGFPPLYFFGNGIASASVGDFALFAACSILPFALVCWLISRSFVKIATTKRAAKKAKYVAAEMPAKTPLRALVDKELKHFVGTPMYIFNYGLGSVLMLGAAVLVLIKGSSFVEMMLADGMPQGFLGVIVCGMLAFLAMTVVPASCSISLEGRNIRLLKSFPLAPAQIFISKLAPNIIFGNIPAFICSAACIIALPLTAIEIAAVILLPQVVQLFAALFGLCANIRMPRFDWTNEAVVIKQSGSVGVAMFGTFGASVLPVILYFTLMRGMDAPLYLLAVCVPLFAALDALCLLYITKRGAVRLSEMDK